MLLQRIISSIVIAPLLVLALYQLSPFGFLILVTAVCLLAAWEWTQLAGVVVVKSRVGCVFLFALLLVGILFSGWITSMPNYYSLLSLILQLSLVWWVIALGLIVAYPRKWIQWASVKGWRLLFGIAVLIPFWLGLLVLRLMDPNPQEGAGWLLYGLLLVWSVDIGGYFFGSYWGKYRLSPQVSPGKTWEGLTGGILLALAIAYGWWHHGLLINRPSQLLWMVAALVIALSAVVGDLTESMLKRIAGLKDSGDLIPGHGGILDRIDSLTAAIPILAWLRLGLFQ